MDGFRRSALVLLVLLPMVMLVGCGGDDDDDDLGRIAFQSGDPADPNIFVMNDDVSNPQLVIEEGRDPALRRDGRVIALARGGDIYTVTVNGSGLTNLTNHGVGVTASDPAFNRQSTRIAYVLAPTVPNATASSIRVMDSNGENDEEVIDNGEDPDFSPSGNQIAFARDGNLFLVNTDGTGLIQLTDNEADEVVSNPSFSPAGDRIVYEFAEDDTATPSLRFIQLVDRMETELVTDGQQPTYSPFGDRVAFVRDGAIYSINVNGTDLRQLTTGTDDTEPSWSLR